MSVAMCVPVLVALVMAVLIVWIVWDARARQIPHVIVAVGYVPWVGHSIAVLRNMHRYLDWIVEVSHQAVEKHRWGHHLADAIPRQSPPVQINLMTKPPIVVLNDVASVKHILQEQFERYAKSWWFDIHVGCILGRGIFNSDGARWIHQRKTASHLFTHRNLREHMHRVFAQQAQVLANVFEKNMNSGQIVDVQDQFFRYTMDAFCEIAFGVKLNNLEAAHPFLKAFDIAQTISMKRFFQVSYVWRIGSWLALGEQATLARCIDEMDAFVIRVIHANRQEAASNPDLTRPDLISQFLDKSIGLDDGRDPVKLSYEYLRDITLNFIIAGRDTTAITLTWCIWMLHLHPEVQRKVVEELDRVLEDVPIDASPSPAQCQRLVYLTAVLHETLRLYPPVPADNKICVHDDVLPDGTPIPKGTVVMYSMYNLARQTSIWGENAAQFDPSRWLDPQGEAPSPFKFVSFNAGPRVCLGRHLAMLELQTALSILLRRFQFVRPSFEELPLDHRHQVTYASSITLPMKGPLWMNVRPRIHEKVDCDSSPKTNSIEA